MDPDLLVKAHKEARAFIDLHNWRCRACLGRIAVQEYDADGDPVVDEFCGWCLILLVKAQMGLQNVDAGSAPRTSCNRCYDGTPLSGMAWCGACAIKHQHGLRGQGSDDPTIDARIAHYEKMMAEAQFGRGYPGP